MRRVISLWLPRFATDRLYRSHPDWRDRPLVTTMDVRGARRLAAINETAATAGLKSGMSLADARAILPEVHTAEANSMADDHALARLASWCGRYSPWTTVDGTGGETAGGDAALWLDVSGCAHLFGGEAALLDDLTGRLAGFGLAHRTAIADTPGSAWACARYASGTDPWIIVAPGTTRAALAPLPVTALRLTPETAVRLSALGLQRVENLLPLPRTVLTSRFGNEVGRRLDQALGREVEPISPDAPKTSHSARLGFPEPIGHIEDIVHALDLLLDRLCAGLERAHLGARQLSLTLYAPDGATTRIAVRAGQTSRDSIHLARLFAERLDGIKSEFGFDAMTLTASITQRLAAAQTDLAGHGDQRGSTVDISRLTDRLSNRLGAASVLRLVPHESYLPERAVRAVPTLDAPKKQDGAWPATQPHARSRPPRLLARPEPVEVMAPIPDDPPMTFRWRRMSFRVARADGPERVTPEWWLQDGDPSANRRRQLRDYYRVEDTAGRRFWLYREGLYSANRRPAWFLHGMFG